MASPSRFRRAAMVIVLGAVLTSGCADPNLGSANLDRPLVDDVDGREPVNSIEIVTKTQAEDPTRYQTAKIVADAWTAAGIETTLLPVGTAQLNSMTATSKNYDVYIIGYAGTPERLDPDNFLSRFTSENATDSGSNMSMYINEDFDEAYESQLHAENDESRLFSVLEAQRLLAEDVPALPLIYPSVASAYREDRWANVNVTAGTPLFSPWNVTRATPSDERDELVIGTTIDPSTFNPVLATQNQDLRPLQLIYDTALTFSPDGELIESAADSYTADPSKIEVKLKDGLEFSDGTPLTGEDLKFSIEYLRDQSAPLFSSALTGVGDISVDDNTVTIALEDPSSAFPAVALANLPILPKHIWSALDDPSLAEASDLVGSGPYTFVERAIGQHINFARNEHSHIESQVSRVSLRVLGNFDAVAGALESGQIDFMNPAETVSAQYSILERATGVKVVHEESHGWMGLHFNTSREPLADEGFRKALAHLVPIEAVIDIAYQGEGTSASSTIAPTLEKWHDPDLQPLTHDPEKAMSLLEEAGFGFDSQGTLYGPAKK